jgi:hypothetical protein
VSYQDGLRQADASLDPLAALRAPTTALLGVNEPVRQALAELGLDTIFDLATSPLFALAYEVGEALQGRGSAALFRRFDAVPGGASTDAAMRLGDFATAPLSTIRALTPVQAARLQAALQVETVADLGRWMPYRSARRILESANGGSDPASDGAGELVPRMGEFPTERRYYSTIVMDHVAAESTVDLAMAGPVDIAPAIEADFGFSAPAVGARLTFEQSWYAHGVTLGNLLHSVALAPGESTRVAVVDWSRQTRASGAESIAETEALTSSTSHNRAVSEVQQAVATEVQSGFSHTESTASTEESGGGFGFSAGPITLGGSASGGTTTTSADSFSTSAGSRELAASMSQQVMDATQQAASSVRNRRATIVKEIAETEHERVSTRILANYNHMHALTVQYYEVVEVYRVLVRLHEAERCLFVPMKLVDFDERTVARYQGALAAAALTRRARELLSTEFGMVRLTPVHPMRPFLTAAAARAHVASLSTALEAGTAAAPAPTAPAVPSSAQPMLAAWQPDEIRRASRVTGAHVVRPGSTSLLLPRDATLEGIGLALEGAGAPVTAVAVRPQGGQPAVELTRTSIGWRVPVMIPLDELLEIVVTTGAGDARAAGKLTLEVSYRGSFFPVTMPVSVEANASTVVARAGESETGSELLEHLRANRLHYNQVIWRSLDASTIALLLSRFTFEGQPVAQLIHPRPIQVAGNYLVFRMPGFVARAGLAARREDDDAATPEAAARQSWNRWLTSRGLTFGREATQEQLVPVPTGGVFAEAVLGRSNAAEKLDATRFWNWQDSPIPLQPPEIAAINMASRAQPVDVTPGQLGQPVLNIVNPTALPDPTGLGPMLGALRDGSMFRDMAGLAATIGLAQGTSEGATSAAADAGRLAAANLAVAAQKEIEQQRIAAQLAMAMMGNPAALQGTPKNISEMGALLNTAEKRDASKRGGAASGGSVGDGGSVVGGGDGGGTGDGGGSSGGGGAASGVGGSTGGDGGSSGDLAFRRALFGGLGVPAADLVLAGAQTGSGGSAGGGPAQFVREIFFYADVNPMPNEVAAIDASTWHPSSLDFAAISYRSAGNRNPRPDAKVATAEAFLRMLAQPAERFNFFGYGIGDELHLQSEVRPDGGIASEAATEADDPRSPAIGLAMIVALRELQALSSGGGPMAELVRAVLRRNKDFHDQRGRPGEPALRELWLAMVTEPPSHTFALELARALRMRVVIYPERIHFRPEVGGNPRKILKRGVIELAFRTTSNLHTFDEQGIAFDP